MLFALAGFIATPPGGLVCKLSIKLTLGMSILVCLVGLFPGSAEASKVSQAYYLFYRVDTNRHANCTEPGNTFLASRGTVGLSPYYYYTITPQGSKTTGDITYVFQWDDYFSSAVKDLYCRYGDYVYEYFGDNQARRFQTQSWVCYGDGCQYLGSTYGPWRHGRWPYP